MRERNQENKEGSNAANEPTPIYLNSDSTLQTPEEAEEDHGRGPQRDEKMDVSNDDLHDGGSITPIPNADEQGD